MALARFKTQIPFLYKANWKKYLILFSFVAGFVFYVNHRIDSKIITGNFISQRLFYDYPNNNHELDFETISYLRNYVIFSPSGLPYNLSDPEKEDFSQDKQGVFLREYFSNKKNGTFIEAGALDGEVFSNTLILERQLGWTGLLIEPNPLRYPIILEKNRKAHSANCCIALTPKPEILEISIEIGISHLIGHFDTSRPKKSAKVSCFPLYSIMVAMNLTTLDLLSLDVESVEVKILETIPWHKVDIKTILLEAQHVPEGIEYLRYYLATKKYMVVKKFRRDLFFVKQY